MTDDALTSALAEIRDRNEWRIEFHRYTDYTVEHDVAEGDVRRLLAVVEAALGHHEPVVTANGVRVCPLCSNAEGSAVTAPCPEVQAITRELTGEDDSDAHLRG